MANNSNRKAIEFMVQGALPPHSTNVLWMDTSVPTLPVLKIFQNGAWTTVHTEQGRVEELLTKTVPTTAGNFASLDENGNVIDSEVNGDVLASTFAPIVHNHDTAYAAIDHNHLDEDVAGLRLRFVKIEDSTTAMLIDDLFAASDDDYQTIIRLPEGSARICLWNKSDADISLTDLLTSEQGVIHWDSDLIDEPYIIAQESYLIIKIYKVNVEEERAESDTPENAAEVGHAEDDHNEYNICYFVVIEGKYNAVV